MSESDVILVPLDGSALAEQALPHAAALARRLGAAILLTRVPEPQWVTDISAGLWVSHPVDDAGHDEEARDYLAALVAHPDMAGLDVRTELATYPVVDGLLDLIKDRSPRLVVLTTHGRSGLERLVPGSVADKLIRASHAPLYIVRAAAEPRGPAFDRLLVALDGSPLAEAALAQAQALAAGGQTGDGRARLLLAHVPTVPGYASAIPETAGLQPNAIIRELETATAYLEARIEALRATGVEAESRIELVAQGSVADGLLNAARDWGADVVFLTPHGRTGLGRWLFGSVSSDLIRRADRPVWLARES